MPTLAREGVPVGWSVWLQWVVANALAFGLGALVGETVRAPVSPPAVGALLFGTVLGVAQWLVLRRRLAHSGWWVLATIGGWAVAGAVGFVLSGGGTDVETQRYVGAIVSFAASGTAQWLVLRRQVRRAGWWIPASIAGVVGGGLVFNLAGILIRLTGSVSASTLSAAQLGFTFVSGAIAGAISGAVLIWLLRQPVSDAVLAPN